MAAAFQFPEKLNNALTALSVRSWRLLPFDWHTTAADEESESELQPMTSPKTSNDCR